MQSGFGRRRQQVKPDKGFCPAGVAFPDGGCCMDQAAGQPGVTPCTTLTTNVVFRRLQAWSNAMQLPDSELAVMECLWTSAPQTAEDLIAHLGEARGWQPSTVKTLLARLVKKGALSFERDGRRFLYAPVWEREAFVLKASRSFLDSLFDGRLTPLVAHLSRHRKLSAADRDELAKLLEQMDRDHAS